MDRNIFKMDESFRLKNISIVTATLNSDKTLDRCIQSVTSNKEYIREHIIVDGGSWDNTVKIIKRYQNGQSRIADGIEVKLIHQEGIGIYNAMNLGVKHCCSSSFVGILNSDDEYIHESLSFISQNMDKDCELIHGICEIIHKNGHIQHSGFHHCFLPYKSIAHPTVFISKKTYERYGLYDERISLAADYDYLLRLYRSNVKMLYVSEIISRFYIGGASYKKEYLSKWQYISIRKKYGSITFNEYCWELLKVGFKVIRHFVQPRT